MGPSSIIDRYRRPEYTGENRCLPCTAVNVTLGLVVAMGALLVTLALGHPPELALAVEGIVFVGALGRIWLVGYLIPGTPTLTARYLPGRVRRLFGKEPDPPER